MSKPTDVKFDLLKIDLAKNHTQFLDQLSGFLEDLGDDLQESGITSVNVRSIQTSYEIEYGLTSSFNVINLIATVPDPTLNYIVVGGDVGNVIVGALGDDILLGGDGSDVMLGIFGSNILSGGGGNDVLFGIVDAAGTPSMPIILTGPSIDSPNFLLGDGGDDLLVGSIGVINANFLTVDNITQSFGGHTLLGGEGNDTMVGIHGETYLTALGTASTPYFLNGDFTYMSNNLEGGAGNDHIFGSDNIVINHFSYFNGFVQVDYLGNTISGGAGDDVIISHLGFCEQNWTNSVGTGSYTFAGVTYSNVGLVYVHGNSTLDGGDGNDILMGDCDTIVHNVTNDPGTGLFISIEHCSSDTLIGGAGNDELIGDARSISSTDQTVCIRGDNTLFGGEGDDVITGGVKFNNVENTVLGHNSFVYDGTIDNGDDMILDFNVGLDTLVGQKGAMFTNSGLVDGNLVINVIDAGASSTITLLNVHTDVFASIMQSHATVIVG